MPRIKNECYVLYEHYEEKLYQLFILISFLNFVLTSFDIWLKWHKHVHSFAFALTNSSPLNFTHNTKSFNFLLNVCISFAR